MGDFSSCIELQVVRAATYTAAEPMKDGFRLLFYPRKKNLAVWISSCPAQKPLTFVSFELADLSVLY